MIDKRAAVYAALQADSTLAGIVGDRVFFHYHKTGAVYPQIVYLKIDDLPEISFGNQEDIANSYFQIDAYDNTAGAQYISSMELAIDAVMTGLGFHRSFSGDEYDETDNIYHLIMRYEGLFN